MAHTPERSILPPFTRRGPPTEDEERKALEERRAATAAGEAPPRRFLATLDDPLHPSHNRPAKAPGPEVGRELREQNREQRRILRDQRLDQRRAEQEQRRVERNRRLREAGRPEEELPSERRARSEFNKQRFREQKEQERRDLGLPPTSRQRGEDIRVASARAALLDDDLEGIPQLKGGTPEQVAEKIKANPKLMDHGQLVRSGGQVFRYSSFDQAFTPVRRNPVTGKTEIDTSNADALTDANIEQAYSNGITTLKDALATADLDAQGQIRIAIGQLEATQGALDSLPRDERLNVFNKIMAKALDKFDVKEPISTVEQAMGDNFHELPKYPGNFVSVDKDGNPKLQHVQLPKPGEKAPPVPSTLQEFLTEGDTKQQLANFSTLEKQARAELEAEAKVELDAEKAAFATKAKIAFDKKVTAAGKKEVDAIKAAGPELFAGPESPPLLKPGDVRQRVNEIFKRFLDARGPVPTAETSSESTAATAPVAATLVKEVPAVDTGFKGGNIAAVAKELGMSVEEARARLRNLVPP